jgi:hypothetical protein
VSLHSVLRNGSVTRALGKQFCFEVLAVSQKSLSLCIFLSTLGNNWVSTFSRQRIRVIVVVFCAGRATSKIRGLVLPITKQTNFVSLSPRANYTDWSTATCQRNLVPTFVDRGVSRGQRGGSPAVVNLSFLDRSCYFSFEWRLIYPHEAEWTPFETHCYSENLVAPEIEPATSGLAAKNSDHYTTEAVHILLS